MFEFILGYDNEAISIIIKDHETAKELFEKFEKAQSRSEKVKIAAKTVEELSIHAIIEEEIFYPAVRKAIGEDIMNEADEEHHVARILCAELSVMTGSEDHYDAKYKVLAENIKHHIKEEEHEMLPKAKGLDINYDKLAALMLARKEQLKRTGLPVSLEDRMVQATRNNDTPAREAKRTAPKKPTAKPAQKLGKKPGSPAMMQAKGKTAGKAQPAKVKPGTGKAKPVAKSAKTAKPKLKIVAHRAANASKAARKTTTPKAKSKRR